MPISKDSVRVPKYRHHKPTGQALVEIKSRRIYLGPYDRPEDPRALSADRGPVALRSGPRRGKGPC